MEQIIPPLHQRRFSRRIAATAPHPNTRPQTRITGPAGDGFSFDQRKANQPTGQLATNDPTEHAIIAIAGQDTRQTTTLWRPRCRQAALPCFSPRAGFRRPRQTYICFRQHVVSQRPLRASVELVFSRRAVVGSARHRFFRLLSRYVPPRRRCRVVSSSRQDCLAVTPLGPSDNIRSPLSRLQSSCPSVRAVFATRPSSKPICCYFHLRRRIFEVMIAQRPTQYVLFYSFLDVLSTLVPSVDNKSWLQPFLAC